MHGDFIDLAEQVPEADAVTLDRVVCCYPDATTLVGASARKARRVYGLVYPRRRLGVRIFTAFPESRPATAGKRLPRLRPSSGHDRGRGPRRRARAGVPDAYVRVGSGGVHTVGLHTLHSSAACSVTREKAAG
jgi:hypothetical protein